MLTRSLRQGHAFGRALFLALPRQLRLGTAGLVPKLVLQDMDRRLSYRHGLHATCHDFHAGRPTQGVHLH